MFDLRSGASSGQIYLREGQIVHASTGRLHGEEAVYELAIWPSGDFIFTPGREAASTTIQKSNTNLLMEAARRIDEWQILSKKIASTRLIPVFKDQAVNTSVSFTPQEWAIICRMDERRSIEDIAMALGTSPFETAKHLYGLVTSGLLDLRPDFLLPHLGVLRKLADQELIALQHGVHQLARELFGDRRPASDLDAAYRLCAGEAEAGRALDALLDLIRNHEKTISANLGAEQARNFVEGVRGLLPAVANVG
jgi:hypothetical protein